MVNTALYEDLARHLDQGTMGAPRSPTPMKILEILFPQDEVQIALRLPMKDKTLAELRAMYPEHPDIEEKLNQMVDGSEKRTRRRSRRMLRISQLKP